MTANDRHSRIPEFSTREEEAQWWDTHSITDYLDELEPVEVRYKQHLSKPLSVRLNEEDRKALTQLAHEQGIGPSTLIRMWVKERLNRTERKQAS
jgi:predicted HicB family RNase H-like nuclease